MKCLKFIISLCFIFSFASCKKWDKLQEQKNEIKAYQNSGVDSFYYIDEGSGSSRILPLIKPFKITAWKTTNNWSIDTGELENELGGIISPIQYFGIQDMYIYGYKPYEREDSYESQEKWFLINVNKNTLIYFDSEEAFKSELKKYNLLGVFFDPNKVYESFKENPVLPWFPQDVKEGLEAIRKTIN